MLQQQVDAAIVGGVVPVSRLNRALRNIPSGSLKSGRADTIGNQRESSACTSWLVS